MRQSSLSFRVSVVLPSYNEKDNIKEAVKRISASLGKNLLEIIVVDDNSPDGTWKIVKNIGNPKVKLIRRMHERGLASALARGVNESKGNVVVWMDCDLGIPPEEIPRLVKKLDEYDIVIGSRYVHGGKDTRANWRVFLSILINIYSCLLLGTYIKDHTSGFAAVRKEVFKKVKFPDKGFGEYFVELMYLCSKRGFRIAEVGYGYGQRKGGLSKSDGNLLVLLKYGIQYCLKIIKWRFTI
ncbi:glycosyltransferase [Candidatus Woesearchaeota archaeon]|nr:glycosyltransferase [Candidatus Woesearchaeota archaeon]